MIMCLMLLLSPMSSKAHYVVLFLPCLLLARELLERPSTTIRAIHVLLLICGPLMLKGLTGKMVGDLMLAWGIPTYFVLVNLRILALFLLDELCVLLLLLLLLELLLTLHLTPDVDAGNR